MKRYIVLFCAFTILLGSIANRWANAPANMPAKDYVVSQPSGETFTVNVSADSILKPPFPVGTSLAMVISLREDRDDPNSFPLTAHYTVYLAEDGYWYFAKCVEVVFKTGDNYEHTTVYQEGDSITYRDIWDGNFKEIYAPSGLDARVMIDPLPDEVHYIASGKLGPFDLRKTTPKEKTVMSKMITAEQERLAALQVSTSIEDPGPEAFIYETIETSDGSTSQAAETTSTIEAVVTTSEEEASPTGDASTASAASEPMTAVQNQTSKRSWLPTCLIGGGIVVVLSGGIVTLLAVRRKRGK